MSIIVVWFAAIAGGSAAAAADDTSATIRVRVAVAPGTTGVAAAVGLRAEDDPNRYWSSDVAGHGTATFRSLPPGIYQVTVALPDRGSVATALRVEAGEIVTIDATLQPEANSELRVEIGERTRDGQGTDFRASELRDLPSADNLWALIDTAAPFLIADRFDNGGLLTGRSALVGNRGASFTATSLTFGDVRIANPNRLGDFPILPDLNAVQAVSLSSGLAPVEIAAPGAAIALTLRRPTADRYRSLQTAFTAPAMVSVNARDGAPSVARLDKWGTLNAQYAGPVRERTGVFISNSFTASQQQDRDRAFHPVASVGSLFAHVVSRPTDRDEVRVIAAMQRATHGYDGRFQFRNGDASERDMFVQTQMAWEQIGAVGNRHVISVGFRRGSFTPRLRGLESGTIDRVFDGPVPATPSAVVTSRIDTRFEFQLHDLRKFNMDHSLRTGVSVGRSFQSLRVVAAPAVGELVNGLPARVWLNVAPNASSGRHVVEVEGYFADQIAVGPHLGVEAGVRAELLSGIANHAARGITWRTLAPRVSFRWAPAALTVFGGYSRYYPRLSLDLLAFGDPGEPGALVYRWTDPNGNRAFEQNEIGVLISQQGRGQATGSIDPKLRAPSMNELTIGAERRLGRSMIVRGTMIFRREHSLLGSVNTGVPASSYSMTTVPDQGEDYMSPSDDRQLPVYDRLPSSFGNDRFLLTNPSGGDATYDGAEVTWELRSGRWYSLAGAMAYRTRAKAGTRGYGPLENDQGVVGELGENPNAATYALGSVFFDRSYVGKWTTSYHGAHDVRVAVSARYQDGQPFSRLVIAPNLAQGPEAIEAYRTGRTRFTFTLTVDARIEKGLRIAGHRAAIRLDMFNLSNTANEVEENPVTGALFRRSTAIQPPRTLRLGFRIEF